MERPPVTSRRRSRTKLLAVAALGIVGVVIGLVVGHQIWSSSDSECDSTSTVSTTPTTKTSSSSQEPPTPGRPIFLLTGDSLTEFAADPLVQGWVTRLQYEYIRKVDVINRGYAGYNTKQYRYEVLPGLSRELKTSIKPSLITLWLGANDAAVVGGRNGYQHISVDTYRDNLIHILSEYRRLSPDAKILLITQPTVDEDGRREDQVKKGDAREPPDRNNEQAGIYAAACREAGKSVDGVTLLDIYDYLMTTYPNATQRASLFEDGLHFNPQGYGLVLELVQAQIKSFFPTL